MTKMNNGPHGLGTTDAIVDEVRGIRRAICEQSGNDIDKLCDELREIAREYDQRRGSFSGVTTTAASLVVESWGPDVYRRDDLLIDEIRELRRQAGAKQSQREAGPTG